MESGIAVARAYHRSVVGPIIARTMPRLRYAAGRLGSGSDVLGFDDGVSRDHDWGLRLTLLLDDADADLIPHVTALLEEELPETFDGLPTRFWMSWDPVVRHKVWVETVRGFATGRLGVDFDPARTPDWLMLTGQGVLEVTAGPVFADTTTGLAPLLASLRWYPPEVARWVLAAGWERFSRLPLLGRVADTGQPLHARRLTGTLVADIMRQAFLLARVWPPYDKWFERAFHQLPGVAELTGPLTAALHTTDRRLREEALVTAVRVLLERQRAAGLPTPAEPVAPFFDRPYRMVDPAVPAALREGLTDPVLRSLPPVVGTLEQWVDNPELLARPELRAPLAAAYRAWLAAPA